MALEYFPFYHSYGKKTEKLTDQELGRLVRALVKFSETGETQELAGRESIAFDFISVDIQNARDAYEEKCAKNRANGTNATERPRTVPTATERPQNKTKTKTKIETEEEDLKDLLSPPTPSSEKKPVAHQRSANGWVKLTDEQFDKLTQDLGAEELARCITYVDELAQSTGNKNGWKDWNMVLRRCSREGWGNRPAQKPRIGGASPQKALSASEWDSLMEKI